MGSSAPFSSSSYSLLVQPTPADPALAVVIVNYRSWDDVATLVSRLAPSPALAAGTCEVVVVDNASGQPVPGWLTDPPPGVRLIIRTINAGFSAGVNAGWHSSRARWLLVLNPDVLPEPDFLDLVLLRVEALKQAVSAPATGIVGFALRNADGSWQPSVGAFPGLARTFWEQFLPRTRRKYQPEWRHRAGAVDWVTGACFLVNSRLLADLGGMDEDFFLYYEEVALCRSATARGWTVAFDPGVAVVHLHPLQDRPVSTKMRIITRHSKLLYFRKHLPGWRAEALSWAIRAEAKARAAWCRLRRRPGVRSWQTVGKVARRLRTGGELRGIAVLAMAEAADELGEGDRRDGGLGGPHARRASWPHPGRRGSGQSRGSRRLSPPPVERTEPRCDSRPT